MAASEDKVLIESIAKIANHLDNGPIKQVPLAKYRAKTPWNPEGKPLSQRPKLRRTVYMSGSRLREQFLSDEEIHLLNKIKAGKYNDRRWSVIETDGINEGGSITILIPNKTPEDRVRLKGEVTCLADLLRKIIAEQEANDPAPARGRRANAEAAA